MIRTRLCAGLLLGATTLAFAPASFAAEADAVLKRAAAAMGEPRTLRFEAEGKAVVFSGDTAYFPPLAEFARGADLLVHEAIEPGGIDRLVARVGNADGRLRRHLHASHTPVEDVGRIAAAAGVGALALHHFVPSGDSVVTPAVWEEGARRHWKGPLHVGHDGLRIALGQ